MGTKNNPGTFDCYQNAEPDEPMFVLLARDKHAPTLVWLWAVLRELDIENPDKVKEARECAVQMVEWLALRNAKAVGIGQSVLAGVLELIRAANYSVPLAMNSASDTDVVRAFFTNTTAQPPLDHQATNEHHTFDVWCQAFDAWYAKTHSQNVPSITKNTGVEHWRDAYNDGLTPAEAFAEDCAYSG